ncbi:SusC/RagA family TonB-linked outer membrane protein [Sphingobacterium sp. MYb388]|uniref:SusC/RagA family TonB-linked outer membrane protein n=1 Tax=Sphingobacterium sp. MYb388 TaxID=2745437 RepID=UPI0030980B06
MYKKNLTWVALAFSKSEKSKFKKVINKALPIYKPILLFSFFILFSLVVNGQVLQEKVKIKFENSTLKNVLQKLEQEINIRFVFNDTHIKSSLRTTGTFDETLGTILKNILETYELDYDFVDNQYIVLKQRKSHSSNTTRAMGLSSNVNQNGFVQSGIVVDESGYAISGVTVSVINASNVVLSDEKGFFSIGVIDDSYSIRFHHLGYKTVEQKSMRNAIMRIKLEADPSKLDEVLVIGYGTTTRRNTTGSSAGITAKEIQNTPTTNLLNSLQGRIPGIYVNQSNGLPGSTMNISIRGTNSVPQPGSEINRNIPLFIVDGVPFNPDALSGGMSGANGATSPLNIINPMDIESIDILKDADATAIYGSRAANGVILITTKRGKVGKTQFDVMFRTGVAKVSQFVETLNTEQYLNIRRKGFENVAVTNPRVTPESYNAFDLTQWDQTAYTDFQKLLIGNTAKTTDANLSVSGGDVRTNFRLSGTYHKEGNVFVGDQGYTRSALNFNLQHKALNDRFTIGFSGIYSADNNDVSVLDQTSIAYNLPPNYPLYNEDGSLYWSGLSFGVPANPLGQLNQTVKNKGTNLVTNLNLAFQLWKGLTLKTNLGYGRSDSDEKRLVPRSSMDPNISTNVANSIFGYRVSDNYTIEPQLDYVTEIGQGKFSTMIGGTWQHSAFRQPFSIMARDFPSDDFLENIASAGSTTVTRGSSEYKYASVFGRINYNFLSRYILNINFRRDGSSRFAENSRYGNFGSFGAAWILSEEPFLKSIPTISFAKLRSSYGWVGNDKIGDYMYYDSYQSVTYLYNGVPGIIPARLANSDFQWESTRKFELALDLGILKDKLSFSAAFYRNTSGNQLINYTLSPQAGFSSYQANFPAVVQNKGWEFTLSTQNINSTNFRWTTDANLSINRNKLLEFPNIQGSSYYTQYVVGKPLSSYYAYEFTGFDATTGLPTVGDLNGDGRISSGYYETGRGDRSYRGTGQPSYYGGITNTLTYKKLTFDFLFQFVKREGRSILTSSFYPPGYDMTNYAAKPIMEYINAGIPSLPQITAAFTPAYTAYSNYVASNATVVDASFIRLKNVSLSYDVSGAFTERLKIKNLRLQLQGHNLFTITDYFGFDPESQGLSLPPLRTIVGTVQLTF